jgi:cytochrome c553
MTLFPSILAICKALSFSISALASEQDFFESNIRPVLAEHCYACHGSDKNEGALRLNTAEDFNRGGSHGTLLADPDNDRGSLLAVLKNNFEFDHLDIELSDTTQADLLNWIQSGAPWPQPVDTSMSSFMAEFVAAAKNDHWAFQPVTNPPLPAIKNPDRARTPIDHFILAKLDAANLALSPMADPHSLLRRIYYDLIGLPPTYDQVQAFSKDPSPEAIKKFIDTLLASPQYGERWGRYWLDVARYSDTKGFGREAAERYLPFPHTYRDYVIRAFNEDLPYDQFIVEQLAADQLDLGEDLRPLAAMGFITIGRQFQGDQHATLDDQIDVVMRGFQGLTVSCARCHDHKFDPIPTADYYSLYGIFRSSHLPSDLPLIGEPDESSPEYQSYKTELDERETLLADFLASLESGQKDEPENKKKADAHRVAIRKHINSHPGRPDRAMVLADTDPLFDPYIFLRGKAGQKGEKIPRRFLAVLSKETRTPFDRGSGRLNLARSIASNENPLTARVFVNRVWMHHFGQALVGTPSDFGYQGSRPTHPELLDHLAFTFMEDGWSLKALHKRIMLSSTYLQSSAQSAEATAVDPENELLWRYKRHRLDFEAMHDSLLAVSGNLDRKIGGRSENMVDPPFSNRRAVYAEIDRQNLPTLFSTFDFPTPNAHSDRRFQTTVPQQSLYMMNNGFVTEQARKIAQVSANATLSSKKRIQAIYRKVLARKASKHEVALGLAFIDGIADLPPLDLEMPKDESDWLYGYGSVDEENGQVLSFTEFPYWSGEAYQGDEDWPKGNLGWAQLVKHGGHPGDAQHAVIRRWVSPVDSTISFVGELHHFSSVGNGIKGYVISSREGIIWSGEVQDKFILTEFQDRPIQKGDTVDLIVLSNGGEAEDKFRWHPRIFLSGEDATQYPKQDWLSRFDYHGPAPKAPEPLDPWAQYAQVLLMSNEFIFID